MDDGHDVVLPMAHGHRQPLAAAYRPALASSSTSSGRGRLKPAFLFDRCRVLRLGDDDLVADLRLAAVDPALDRWSTSTSPPTTSRRMPVPPPRCASSASGCWPATDIAEPRTVRAATIGAAALAADLAFDRHVVAAINGDRITHDGGPPLVVGDTVTFVSADAGGPWLRRR